jgi:hypothetical protein
MPFVPLDPEDENFFPEQCFHPEHNPPGHMVITKPMKWVCPGCGSSTVVRPREVYMAEKKSHGFKKEDQVSPVTDKWHGSDWRNDFNGAED